MEAFPNVLQQAQMYAQNLMLQCDKCVNQLKSHVIALMKKKKTVRVEEGKFISLVITSKPLFVI